MVTQKMYRSLIASLFACMFAVFVAGCDAGSGGRTGTEVPLAATFVDLTAIPGPIVAVRVGEVATLDGSGSSTTTTEPLSYSWSFSHKPYGSAAELQGATTAAPSFIADVHGVYMVQLLVSIEGVTSERAIAIVIVTNEGESLIGPFPGHQGVSSNCVNCHDAVNLNGTGEFLPHKIPNHVATSNMCQACHTPQGYNIIPFVDHQEVFGNCSACHDGVIAIGKSEFHTPTNVECNDCHNTTSFLPLAPDGSYDHSNIVRACAGCHNGTVAIGKTPTPADTPAGNHPATNSDCGNCHTTASFLNAYPDHTVIVTTGVRCDSCHGISATDQPSDPPVGHPSTRNTADTANNDCVSCHSIVSFKMPGGIFNHSLLDATDQSCESCHNTSTSINAKAATDTQTHRDTTADCGSCHNTESFADAIFDHTDIVSDCGLSCHIADRSGTASGLPFPIPGIYEHMPLNIIDINIDEDCSVCHTPGTFTTGTYEHVGVTNNCESCHNNIISVGKLINHFPTTTTCDVCHNTTTFAGATIDHNGSDVVGKRCDSCHNGDISIGKSVTHLPTSQDCDSCHTTSSTTAPFMPSIFAHTNITDKCETCHNGNSDYVAVGAIGKIVDHIPAQNQCDVCHINTNIGDFASPTTFLTNIHPGISGGCEGCHTSRFIPGNPSAVKSASHLPTNQDCDVCHTSNDDFATQNFNHTGITGNCVSCHDGNANNVAAGALGKSPSPTHDATTSDCGSCHAIGNNFADGTFDHTGIVNNCAACHGETTTDTRVGPKKDPLTHLPTSQDCSVCHVPGTFKPSVFDHTGIVNNCSSCHGDTSTAAVTKKSSAVNHITTLDDCSVCHNTTAFAGATFDHTGITNNCESCHDGATARGKTPPPNHVPTTQDCSVCHQTTGFIPGTFDHAGIVDNCRSCHDGAFAVGKTASHIQTNQDCGICHTTSLPLTFVGGVFDHTGIVDNCASCHDGVTAIGTAAKINPAHLPITLDCSSCHTTATFVGGTWAHDASTVGNCTTCHDNGGGATEKPQGHLTTSVQCDVCHTTDNWAANFSHDPNDPDEDNYPGDHNTDPGCSGCHGNSIDNPFVYPWSQYAPDCAACHAGDFEPKGDHIGGETGTIEQNKNCAGSGCHRVGDSNFD